MSCFIKTKEYMDLIAAAKNYTGPTKEPLVLYEDVMKMLGQADIVESARSLLHALYMVDATRRHLATKEATAENAQSFMKVFTVRFYPLFMFLDHERLVAKAHIQVAELLVSEFDSMLNALREEKVYSFQSFWALLAQYKKSFDGWNELSKEGLSRKVQTKMVLVDRALRMAQAADLNMGILGSIEAHYNALRATLLEMPDGQANLQKVETLNQLEREVFGTDPGFERRMIGLPSN